jgi:hypothetical protein
VTVTAATTVTATFNINLYTLTVTKTGSGTGTVTSSPAGISCGADCTESLPHGTSITLSASAGSGSNFTGWSGGGCSGVGTCAVTMTGATTVNANFNVNIYTVTISRSGSGTVTSSPAGINCGATCTGSFAHGTSVSLTATSGTGHTWGGWGGSGPSVGCNGPPSCTFTIAGSQSISATFVPNSYALSVSKTGTGTGTITSSPAGISCGTDCSETLTHGTVVTLTATPTGSSTFTGWSGACTGTGSCVVTMTAATSVSAGFTIPTYTLTVTVQDFGNGNSSVTSNTGGINCFWSSGTCSANYPAGTSVTLTRHIGAGSTWGPDAGEGWDGPCNGTSSTCTFTMNSNIDATARFGCTSPCAKR